MVTSLLLNKNQRIPNKYDQQNVRETYVGKNKQIHIRQF